ncbi:hypothetical protein [Allobaculum mucilyticum]|uniref:hypothetical protein n=1 Tax=Allobaculum mucilyticum TaxID=2834459 RepID=UPI001E5B607F|nr:hypothetical protein [Allobaculum mucilyticum]UNT96913.1 hypothetical protein KWG62_03965 [Allobaculum mucilyticum]
MKRTVGCSGLLLSLALMLGSAVPAAAAPSHKDEAVRPMQQMRIPVQFKNCTDHDQAAFASVNSKTAEPYDEGFLVAFSVDQKAQVEVDGKMVTANLNCLAITDEEKEELRKLQDKEIEEQEKRRKAAALIGESTPVEGGVTDMNHLEEEEVVLDAVNTYEWTGSVLTPSAGVNMGPSGKETYYNLPMEGVVSIMRDMGNTDEYWVRDDGVKMLGDYVMIAAHLPTRPRGSLVPTSLGMGIVCDTGTFALNNHTQIDIAVAW